MGKADLQHAGPLSGRVSAVAWRPIDRAGETAVSRSTTGIHTVSSPIITDELTEYAVKLHSVK